MQLSRESIRRMIGSGNGLTVGFGGSSSGGSGGGVSIPYYNQNFEILYKKVVTDGTTGDVTTTYLTAQPNEIVNVGTETDPTTGDVTVTTIVGPKAKKALVIGDAMLVWDAQNSAVYVINRDGTTAANFYATGGVSALGYSPGGGGGGASALTDLVDVAISNPTNGQVLMYNSSTGKWYNGNVQSGGGGTVTSITAGTGLTGGTITTSGTIALSEDTQTAITAGVTAYGWGDHSQAGYLTSSALTGYATQSWVNNQGFLTSSALNGYATQSWITQQGFLKVNTDSVLEIGQYLDFHVSGSSSDYSTRIYASLNVGNTVTLPLGTGVLALTSDNVASATKLQTARTIWGQSFDGTANITGGMENVGVIYQNGRYTVMGRNEAHGAMFESLTNTVTIGLHDGNGIGWDTRSGSGFMMQMVYDASNTVTKKYTRVYDGLRIGDGMIVWDGANNAFQVIKSDGTAANLYTTGGVSALGMSAGVSSIDAMTFGNLTVNSLLTLPSTIVAGTSPTITQYANDSDCIYLFYDSGTSKINSKTYRFTQYDNVGIHGTDYNYDETWFIDPDGCARFSRVYLNSNTYIHTNGSDLLLTIGSTTYKLTKTTI